jgi:surface polysaccharide O-acyltransferase-like enzyme
MKNSTTTYTSTERIVFLDYLRVVACFMVILVHCIEPFYLNSEGTYIASRSDALWVTFINSLLRIAVPLFVMASSYLLLPLKSDTQSFYRRRFERVAIPFIFWSLAYAFIPMWGSGGEVAIAENMKQLSVNLMWHSGHLWFVYMLIGLYLFMPILSPWLERVSQRGQRAFLLLWLFSTAVPFFRELALTLRGTAEVWGEASWNEFGLLYYFSGFIGYIVASDYIRKYVDWGTAKSLCVALPMIAVGYLITALPFYAQLPDSYPVIDTIDLAVRLELSWDFTVTGVALMTLGVFLLFKLIKRPTKGYAVIGEISRLSYGVYLLHMFVLVAAFDIVSSWSLGTPLTMLVSAALTFIVATLLTKLISLLPKSKYIVG